METLNFLYILYIFVAFHFKYIINSQRVCLEEEQCGIFRLNFENGTYKILINNPKNLH